MGLKSDAVEMKYKLMHNEKLPDDWLLIVKNLSLLSVEKLVGGNFLYPPEVSSHSIQYSRSQLYQFIYEKCFIDDWLTFVGRKRHRKYLEITTSYTTRDR